MPHSSLCRTAAPRLHLLHWLLLPDCICFTGCCSPCNPLQLLLPVYICIRFNCCSPFTFSAAARRTFIRFGYCSQLCPFQLLPDCVRFNCCFLIASASAAAPRQLFWKISAHGQCSRTFFAEFEGQ